MGLRRPLYDCYGHARESQLRSLPSKLPSLHPSRTESLLTHERMVLFFARQMINVLFLIFSRSSGSVGFPLLEVMSNVRYIDDVIESDRF